MYCRSCNTQLADGAVACTNCGKTPLNGNAYCQNCGQPTEPAAVMCTKCGHALSTPGAINLGSTSASNRVVCAVCAILLGSLGVHKFLNKYNTEGIITLCVSFLTCGVGAVVMQVIGIIEGIKYLQMTDQEFDATYVQGRKGWF